MAGLAGFGQELLGVGVQAVVAMQQAIRDDLAVAFSGSLYSELVRSGRVDRAVTEGRRYPGMEHWLPLFQDRMGR